MRKQAFPVHQTIEVINTEKFNRSYSEFIKGRSHFAELKSGDFLIREFSTQPLTDFQAPENFPECCNWHQTILENAKEKLNEFPGCCDQHKKLIGKPWFDKMDFSYLPEKAVNTVTYTMHCIESCACKADWYKEITDYIEYTVKSFGQLPFGYGPPLGLSQYLSCIEQNIPNKEQLTEIQKDRLLDFISKYTDPDKKSRPTDLNQLIDIYKQWLRVFPFNVSYLSHLKPHFQQMLPMLCGPVETNLYTGISSSRLISKKQLLRFLTDTTQDIIKKLNALEAFKNGKLGDREKTSVELANARHQLNLESLTVDGKTTEKRYLKILKTWLKHEKEYINELTKIFKEDYSVSTFILNVIDGIQQLQSGDTNEHCLILLRNNGADRESQVRYWFRNFLKARYKGSDVTAEEENGPGRMDLKVFHQHMGLRIIEFKGWWNQDRKGVSKQLTNYLTDGQDEGYIIMINHLPKKDITADYRKLTENEALGYITGSWQTHVIPNSSMVYHESIHRSATRIKTIYHFILNAYF